MKFLSWNVAGMNDISKCHNVLRKAHKYSVILLQETKLKKAKIHYLRNKWGGGHENVYMASAGRARGVITLFSPQTGACHVETVEDEQGQFLINVVKIQDCMWFIVNMYGDPDTDEASQRTILRFEDKFEEMERKYVADRVVIGGDFNYTLDPRDSNSTSRKRHAEAQWKTFIEERELYDPEDMVGNNARHTYFRHNDNNCSARYDRYYVSRCMLQSAQIRLEPRAGDHAPIVMEVEEIERHRAQWMFDDTMLSSSRGLTIIHEAVARVLRPLADDPNEELAVSQLQEFVDYHNVDPIHLLTQVIESVRKDTSEYGAKIRAEAREKEKALFDQMIQRREEANQNQDEESRERFEEAREKLRVFNAERSNQSIERNFVQFSRAGERMTSYHFSRTVPRARSRLITKLRTEENGDARIITGEEVANYLAEKFGTIALEDQAVGDMSIEEFLGNERREVETCPEDRYDSLEAEISAEELKDAIMDTKNRSTPGPMGISNLLLKELFPLIKVIMVQAANKLLFEEEAPDVPQWLFHNRKVVFIQKPGRPAQDENSYRGLSMLENVFKAMSSVLSKRFARALLHVQSLHQYGFTEGRSCMEASRSLIDTIKYARKTGKSLIVLSTDIWKAFDTISHSHMEKCLEFYKFPPKFVTAIMRLVRNGTMKFEVNGFLSREYELKRGTGQGDPKSSYLYNLSVTPLNEYLSNDPEVPRFQVEDTPINPVFFADDNGLMLDGDKMDDIVRMLEKIEEYERVSGLKLNRSKCEVLAVNCNEERLNQLLRTTGMKRVNKLKHLGVIINDQGDTTEEDNITPVLEKMREIADRYSTSTSTPMGRALYAKYLLASRYVHRLQNTGMSEQKRKELYDVILEMTWTRTRMVEPYIGFRAHVAKARVSQDFKHGGMGVPNPDLQMKSIRMAWIRKFGPEHQHQGWYIILSRWLNQMNRPNLEQHLRLGQKDWRITARKMRHIAPFWEEVFEAGSQLQIMASRVDKEWHTLPVMGSAEGEEAAMLNSLEYANPIARPILRSRLKTIGQLFKVDQLGRIKVNEMKTLDTVREEFGYMDAHLWNTVVSTVNKVKRDFRGEIQTRMVVQTATTTLESVIRRYRKGCSNANRLIKAVERQQWPHGQVPRSYATYCNDRVTNIEASVFMEAFERITKTSVRVPVQWTSMQIMLRTLWTKVKEANTRRRRNNGDDGEEDVDDRCLNCGLEPEHTLHLMVNCRYASGIREAIFRQINEDRDNEIQANGDTTLFHAGMEELSAGERRDVDDILLIYKHVVYRTRFRDNNRMPTVKFGIISLIIELLKHANLSKIEGTSTGNIDKYIVGLKREINWVD